MGSDLWGWDRVLAQRYATQPKKSTIESVADLADAAARGYAVYQGAKDTEEKRRQDRDLALRQQVIDEERYKRDAAGRMEGYASQDYRAMLDRNLKMDAMDEKRIASEKMANISPSSELEKLYGDSARHVPGVANYVNEAAAMRHEPMAGQENLEPKVAPLRTSIAELIARHEAERAARQNRPRAGSMDQQGKWLLGQVSGIDRKLVGLGVSKDVMDAVMSNQLGKMDPGALSKYDADVQKQIQSLAQQRSGYVRQAPKYGITVDLTHPTYGPGETGTTVPPVPSLGAPPAPQMAPPRPQPQPPANPPQPRAQVGLSPARFAQIQQLIASITPTATNRKEAMQKLLSTGVTPAEIAAYESTP